MSESAIITESLSKSFGAQAAVSELNLKIQPGAVYGFLGRNGAGKTTTMRMLLGLDPTREPELMQILDRVAFVPQRKQLYPWATPEELVRMNKGFFSRWSDELAARLAQRLEIPMRMASPVRGSSSVSSASALSRSSLRVDSTSVIARASAGRSPATIAAAKSLTGGPLMFPLIRAIFAPYWMGSVAPASAEFA